MSILTLFDGVYDVKAVDGDSHLGGEDFDNRLMNHLLNIFQEENNVDLRSDKAALNNLRKECESAKKILSGAMETDIYLPTTHGALETTITRTQFENLCADLFDRTTEPIERALAYAGFLKSEIDDVVLVGGTTRIPKIGQLIDGLFGKKKHSSKK